ncbi:MAG: glycosyltransferase family 2 protein [Candidatus Omnitrophota bacterium]|nr:glycosyltransferase family 2 protein [Candidatus Omnitrophota bacterium]MDZ4242934.1 glycosyltransferase family 2 protein [Candidatus Omnitrophota bacterium]
MFHASTVSLVIPCLNEEKAIARLLQERPDFIDEVIVVDNGSEDLTAQVARENGARVVPEPRRGYGMAYQAGLPKATGDVIITMDGDGTYPLADIPKMLSLVLQEGYDFVSGCRFPLKQQASMPRVNQWANRVSLWFVHRFLPVGFKDLQSGMWVFRRKILPEILPANPGMGFSQEIKINAYLNPRVKCGEVHIDYSQRIGLSKFHRFKDGLQCLGGLLKMILGKRQAAAGKTAVTGGRIVREAGLPPSA